jgi:hypothetical protein
LVEQCLQKTPGLYVLKGSDENLPTLEGDLLDSLWDVHAEESRHMMSADKKDVEGFGS